MGEQLSIFLNAIQFYTRIPISKNVTYSEEILNHSTRYFPFIGWIVGGVGALVAIVLLFVMPPMLAIFLSIIATILLTGAFHEDGFADFCDGFGGGCTREKILSIMKDSRIGTYGTIGLIGILSFKFLTLCSITQYSLPLMIIVGHSLSRLMPVIVINTTEYSRDDATSKSKPIGKKSTKIDFIIAIVFGLLPSLFIPLKFFVLIIPMLLVTTFLFRKYIHKMIGGYTGDCLGALQQIAEIEFYLGFVIYQSYTL